jgi:mannitol operon repressor
MSDDIDKRFEPLLKTHPHLKEFLEFLPEFNRESDRGMVLIATSFIDDLLKRTLLAFFIEGEATTALIEGFNAPLGTFAIRTAAAAGLGLISDAEFKECNTLRKIRNKFAHHVRMSFADRSVIDLCGNLSLAPPSYATTVTVGAAGQFSGAATALILNLVNRPHYVAEQRRAAKTWPY